MTLCLACGRCGKLSVLSNENPSHPDSWYQECRHCGWWSFAHEITVPEIVLAEAVLDPPAFAERPAVAAEERERITDGPAFGFVIRNGCFWFRVFRRGLGFYDRRRRPALYSERVGHTKVWRIQNRKRQKQGNWGGNP